MLSGRTKHIVKIVQTFFLIAIVNCLGGCTKAVIQSSPTNYIQRNGIGYFLPRGLIQLELKDEGQGYVLNINPKIVPDETALYTLTYIPSSFADDNINITVGEDGLLKNISTTTTDRTVDITKKLLEISKEAAKVVSKAFIPAATVKRLRLKELLNVVIDPDDDKKIRDLHKYFEAQGVDFTLKPLFVETTYYEEASDTPSSIYYRLGMPYLISLKSGPDIQGNSPAVSAAPAAEDSKGKTKSTQKSKAPAASSAPAAEKPKGQATAGSEVDPGFERTEIIYLPSRKGPKLSLDIRRAAFVSKQTTLTFNQGMLTSSVLSKPSEVLAGLDIPLEVVKAVVSLPTELIQLKINTTGVSTQLLTAQQAQIQAQEALIQALQTLEQTKKGSPGAPPTPK